VATLIRFYLWHPPRKMENNPSLFSMTFINRFGGSCGTFGEEKKPMVVNNTKLICPEIFLKNK
jgi:hypothetical protein